jgi:putative oxidoreductase
MRSASEKTTSSEVSEAALSRPAAFDWGLLCLRVWFGASLFLKHGWEKPTNFAQMAAHFPNPLHLGPVPTLVIALISDAICSVLVLVGLGTRWAALYIISNVFVAWAFVHHFQFLTRGAPGEVMCLYIAGFLAIAIMGPGRFSLDHRLKFGRFR